MAYISSFLVNIIFFYKMKKKTYLGCKKVPDAGPYYNTTQQNLTLFWAGVKWIDKRY